MGLSYSPKRLPEANLYRLGGPVHPGLCTMPIGGRTVGDGRVRINTATADELNESCSGLGPEQARLIVAYREERGYLRGPEDLDRIEGIDRGTAAALAPQIDWSVP